MSAPAANDLPLRARPVTDVIPHRPPFLMIDRVIDAEPGRWAVAASDVRPDNPVFAGHFPGVPVLPGVLLVETMAQTACWVLAAQADPAHAGALHVLARINHCTFKQLVRPGDALATRATLVRDLGAFALFDCRIDRGATRIAEAELLVARRPSPTQEILA